MENQFQREKWTYTAFIQAQIDLPAATSLEVRGSYVSGFLDGIMELDPFYRLEANISRKFKDDQIRVSLGIDDIFYRFRNGTINYANMDIEFLDRWFVNEINFNISYRFGNQFLKRKQSRRMGAQDEINRTRN